MANTLTRRAAALAVALTACSMTGCSSGSKPTPPTPAPSKPSTSSTSTATSVPATSSDGYTGPASVPVAARAHTDAGRIAFAKHYVNQINETGKNPRTGILEPLALPTCKTCANFASTVSSLKNSGRHYDGNSFIVRSSLFPQLDHRDLVEIILDSPKLTVIASDGSIQKTYPGDVRAGLVFYLTWQDRWLIDQIKIDRNPES